MPEKLRAIQAFQRIVECGMLPQEAEEDIMVVRDYLNQPRKALNRMEVRHSYRIGNNKSMAKHQPRQEKITQTINCSGDVLEMVLHTREDELSFSTKYFVEVLVRSGISDIFFRVYEHGKTEDQINKELLKGIRENRPLIKARVATMVEDLNKFLESDS